MKKAVLIGGLNEFMRDIGEWISECCQVQLCSDRVEIVDGMLKMVKPDLIVFSLSGSLDFHKDILLLIAHKYPGVPVIVIGSRHDEDMFYGEKDLQDAWVQFVLRPLNKKELLEAVTSYLEVPEEAKKDVPPTILVVDDSPAMLRTLNGMLSSKYKVTFATSSQKAFAEIAKEKPDLILLDYAMPVCDGKQTFEMLQAEESTKDIPVIFLTGVADSDQVKKVLALHPSSYILKPPSEAKLLMRIEDVLKERAARKESD